MKNDNDQDQDIVEEAVAQEANQDECQEKILQIEGAYKRALADYQNLEKRVREERGDLIRSANKDLLLRFLPILDTLMMANQHDHQEGLQVSINQFLDTLKAEGLTAIKTNGEQFDPLLMEVVTTGVGKEGVVIQEVRTGYLLHDKLLRPAQVIVGNGEKVSSKN